MSGNNFENEIEKTWHLERITSIVIRVILCSRMQLYNSSGIVCVRKQFILLVIIINKRLCMYTYSKCVDTETHAREPINQNEYIHHVNG